MERFHILIIALFGFFLMPISAIACEKPENNSNSLEFRLKTESDCCSKENHSCKNESSKKSDNHSCCDNDNHKNSKNNHGCNGKCGHSKCTPSHSFSGFPASLEINIKNNVFDFSNERQKFYQSATFISSGFCSLWLIPKIG